MAVCGIQYVDLVLDPIKILGTHFYYNEKLKEEMDFCLIIANIQHVLKLWTLRNLILEGRIIVIYLCIHGKCNLWDYVTMTRDVRLFKV